MKTKISALIDGELAACEVREICNSIRHDDELRCACGAYVLIGDALRREPHLATEITGTVLEHLVDEPVVFAPQKFANSWREHRRWYRPLLTLAATLAGVAVVAWLGLSPQSAQQEQQLVQQRQAVLAENSDADMQEYLIAHQIHSGGVYLNGETQHIQTVSLNGAESHR